MWHFFHSWGKWAIKEKGDLVDVHTTHKTGTYVVQSRTCSVCDKVQIHTTRD